MGPCERGEKWCRMCEQCWPLDDFPEEGGNYCKKCKEALVEAYKELKKVRKPVQPKKKGRPFKEVIPTPPREPKREHKPGFKWCSGYGESTTCPGYREFPLHFYSEKSGRCIDCHRRYMKEYNERRKGRPRFF